MKTSTPSGYPISPILEDLKEREKVTLERTKQEKKNIRLAFSSFLVNE